MAYNMTLLENSTSIIDLMQVSNTYTDGLLGIFLLVIICFSIYYLLRKSTGPEPNREVFAAVSFAAAIFSILFRLIGLVQNYVVGACVILFIGALVMLKNKD